VVSKKKNSSAKDLQAGGGDVRPVKVIRSEKDALDVLSDLTNKPGELTFQIKFEGWPVLTTNLKGDKFDSSITSSVMTGYLALQQELNRSYTIVKFGEERQPNLSREERDELELEVHVGKGSSDLITVNTPKIFDAIATTLTNMTSTHSAAVLIVLALSYFGTSAVKAWLNNRKEVRLKELEKDEDSAARDMTVSMSKEETRRMELLSGIIAGNPALAQVSHNTQAAHDEFLKAAKSADVATIQGVEVSGEFIREINSARRREFSLRTFKKRARVLRVDTSNSAKYKVTILLSDTQQQITCPLQDDTLDARHKSKISNALNSRKTVTLHLEARVHASLLRDVKILGIS